MLTIAAFPTLVAFYYIVSGVHGVHDLAIQLRHSTLDNVHIIHCYPTLTPTPQYPMDTYGALNGLSIWACLSWLALHRFLLNRGFVLRREGFSTDTRVSFYIIITSVAWFAATCWNAAHLSANSVESQQTLVFLAGVAKGPILPFIVSCYWTVSWIDGFRADRSRKRPVLWSLVDVLGPFDWRSGVPRSFVWSMNLLAVICTSTTASAAILMGDTLLGVLNFIGLGLFLANAVAHNPFVFALHQYADDRLRVVLTTSHHEGTVYVLPSRGRAFDATWSPKVEDEHRAADQEIMGLFRHFRSGKYSLSEPLERLRSTLVAFQKRARVTSSQLQHLAAWIYVDSSLPFNDSRKMICNRAPGIHLLGRELIFALCHAEYLVFMGQGRLPAKFQLQLGRLRSMKRSGASQEAERMIDAIGFRSGLDGFKEATRHIYAIFDEVIDASTYEFAGTQPPTYSVALSKAPSNIEEYVAELWNVSCAHSESTFTAMYFFSLVWSMELGNTNGFHIFPARCKTRDGDLVSQELVWRQAWYVTLIVQLIIKSPLLLGLFSMGILQ